MSALAWLLAAPSLAALSMTAFNLASWPRGRAGARRERVSVLVPARNEERTIARCVRAALQSRHPVEEVIVYDDRSSDGTAERLRRLSAEDPRVRVLLGGPLPQGWIGKPHACHRLAHAARGEVLVFVDADTVLEPEGIERLLSLLDEADLVTAVPRQRTVGWLERLVVPLMHLTYTSWLPLVLVPKTRDPRVVAANGQLMAMRTTTSARLGGFAAVAGEIVDDVALARHAKRSGMRVLLADGDRMASCRMYRSPRALWQGFSKNIHEGVGSSTGLAITAALYALAFVAPYALLLHPALFVPAAIAVGANLSLRGLLAWRFAQPLEGVLLHPFGVLALLVLAANSWRWNRRGALVWSGRIYPPRAQRKAIS